MSWQGIGCIIQLLFRGNIMILSKAQLIAIGVAVILIAGGVTGYFILKDDDDGDPQDKIKSTLAVFGNANNDLDVDDKDLTLMQEIIDGSKKLEDYPFADANLDGVVDAKDKDLATKLMNGENCTVKVISLLPDGTQTRISIEYPLKNVAPFGTNMLVSLINAGGVDKTAGVFRIGYENAEALLKAKVDAGDIINYGASSRNVSDTVFNKFTEHDGELIDAGEGGIGALLLDHSAGAFDERYDALQTAGIPILRLAVADPLEEIGATLLIGFLMGGESETIARTYANESLNVINEIQKKVASLSDSERNTYIAITMGKYVCQNDSTYNQAGKYGGGLAYHLTDAVFREAYVGKSSTKMDSPETLSNYDDVDFILSNRTIDVKSNPGEALVEDWDEYKEFYVNLDCYRNLVYVNNLLPGAVKIAFVAAIVSPDYVSMDYAKGVLEAFNEFSISLNGVNMDNTLIVGTYDDYKAAGGTS